MNDINVVDLYFDAITKETLIGIEKIFSQYFNEDEVFHYLRILISKPLFHENFFAVLDKNKKVVGIGGIRDAEPRLVELSDKEACEVNLLFVLREERRHGIGGIMINHILNLAIENKYSCILGKSSPRFRESGWPFYEKNGLERIGMIEDMVVWKYKIDR